MANSIGTERRKKKRSSKSQIELQLRYQLRTGDTCDISAKLVDLHETGCGVEVNTPLETGAKVLVLGDMLSRGSGMEIQVAGQVAWCRHRSNSTYRAGIAFSEALVPRTPVAARSTTRSAAGTDYYEVLEVSPNASPETIRRVYRALAEQFHPRNPEGGDEERFQAVTEAFRVLGNGPQRLAYDQTRRALGGAASSILNLARAVNELESERVRQQGVLLLLINKRRQNPRQPTLTLSDFEGALGAATEQLEFALWYLRDRGMIQRSDDGRFAITTSGVDYLEALARRETAIPAQ